MRKINTINPKINPFDEPEKLRVCAYARVSTNKPKQLESLDNQIQYYTDKLKNNPDYINCGVYVDRGVSGYKGERPGLDEMLRKVRAGEVDLIITKSVSRFARNTAMLLSMVRELKELGVGIIFEEQKIHTLSADGEFMLTVLGAIAEEERKAVCSNIRWAVNKRFQNGIGMVDTNRLLGYDKDKNGELIINQEQAPIVRRIFEMYLQDIPGYKIAKILNNEGVPTYSKHPWSSHRILRIISNEKYVGDFLMQKTFVDHRGKEVINRGEKPKYYVKDSHPAIIDRADWDKAQVIRESRKRKIYPFTRTLKCPYCGAYLIRAKGWGYIRWSCYTYLNKGKLKCKGTHIDEDLLEEFAKEMDNGLEIGSGEISRSNDIKNRNWTFKEEMVVVEVDNGKNTKSRTKEDYRFIPASEFRRET